VKKGANPLLALLCTRLAQEIRTVEGTTLSYSPRPQLQQRRNIYCFLIRSQFFFFTLRAEHGHAVGELVPFGADVGGDVGELQVFSNASVDRVTVLDNFQVSDFAARFFPAFLFPAPCPTANAVDGVRRVAGHLDGVAGLDFCFGYAQCVIERVQFGGVVGSHKVVQAKPQLREFAGSIHHDAGAGIAGVGFTGTIAVNADIELGRMPGSDLYKLTIFGNR
jgi:hypothetical protein